MAATDVGRERARDFRYLRRKACAAGALTERV